jgi:type VI secretion system secreted protein VgrG
MEMYDYPGGYTDKDVGDKLAQVEAEAAQSLDDRRTGSGSTLSLYAGGLVTLQKHPVDSENQEYLIVACQHYYHAQHYLSGGSGGSGYAGNFEFTPSSRQFRAELTTERPYISGVQSALVVGKKGEEIDVDKLGRITVQFYWDRKKMASRRVRVAQIWAGGKGHRGVLFTPRIGDEVVVQYEEGDPDRPIVVGSVYNGENTVPADLPAKKTYSGFLTMSSKNSSGYNMLLFDDTADSERVKLRAQKDLMFKALNNEIRDIGANQTETVGGDETINVGSPTGGGNFTLNATKTITLNILVEPGGPPVTQIVMNMEGITLSAGMGVSTVSITPEAVSIMTPTFNVTAATDANIMAPVVNIGAELNTPSLVAGAAVVSGIPV